VTATKDRPEVIRFENGELYDAHSNSQIDLSSSAGQEIQQFAEAYGQKNGQDWDSLSGQFRVDWQSRTLMPTSSASS